jgi:hypothetical protein
MRTTIRRILAVAGLAGGALAMRRRRRQRPEPAPQSGGEAQHRRWQAVTVNRPPDEVAPDGRLPDPLGELGDAVEVQLRPAPGDRGTELAARPRAATPIRSKEDPRETVRTALRTSKQLLEAGEILGPHRPPTTQRTLSGLPLELATRRARRKGRL